MANKYSKASRERLDTCHPLLIKLMERILPRWDHTIVCGHRSKEEQNRLYAEGKSQLQYPRSKHNAYPSIAVDIQPYPFKDERDLYYFIGYVKGVADEMGIKLRMGADWNDNKTVTDNWIDAFHIELVL